MNWVSTGSDERQRGGHFGVATAPKSPCYDAWETIQEAIEQIRRARGTRGHISVSQIYDLQQEGHEHVKKAMDAYRRLRDLGLSGQDIIDEMDRLETVEPGLTAAGNEA